jgi:DNA-binding MarR family transcriptional regulator
LEAGLLTESIDPADRRLRHLRTTAAGKKKGAEYEKKMLETARQSTDTTRGKGKNKDPVQDLKNFLLDLRGV